MPIFDAATLLWDLVKNVACKMSGICRRISKYTAGPQHISKTELHKIVTLHCVLSNLCVLHDYKLIKGVNLN